MSSIASTPPRSRPTSAVPQYAPSSPFRDAQQIPPHSPSPSSPSTPMNSTRTPRKPSFAGAVPVPTSPTPPPKQGGGRARDLLRKHYGLGVGPPPPHPNVSQDPMNLDSPAFDAKSYYDQLITTSSLDGLLKRENELLGEIKQLDSERQSLVYNHHHELIAASDTISAVKARADSLDADLDLLRVAFSEISRLGAETAIERSSNS
ncbi:Vps51/Vps67-domain-containing protein [Flagelloscypha sp. PMI_526]|nr:Vps51/Vps67-domain-containing protein [Flagelloscypha sp. PMI_526]